MKQFLTIAALLIAGSWGFWCLTESENLRHKSEAEEASEKMRPSDWMYRQRYFPYWRADPNAYVDALKQRERMMVSSLNKRSVWTQAPWTFAGPTNIGGRIVDIEFNPLRPDTVYAGAATGGVFQSADRGKTWKPIFDDQAVLTVGDIGVDPVHPQVLYVGTGEANGGHNNFAGGGLYKSTDAGKTWTFKGLQKTASIGRVVVDYQNPQTVFVAAVGSYFHPNAERGVYRSKNGGDTWERVLFVADSTGAIDLVQHPTNPQILYAAMWERVRRPDFNIHLSGATGGIYKSTNGGDTWTKLTNGLPSGDTVGRIGLAISKSNPSQLYALYNDGGDYSGLYKTTDGGSSWSQTDTRLTISSGTGGFSWYFGQIRVHPTNPSIVYALDVEMMRSTSGGSSFTPVTSSNMHVDHHAFAFHPTNPNIIIDGNDGGINYSEDGGTTWQKVASLPVNQFYEITLDAQNPQRLYGGTQDNGTLRTMTGNTQDWSRIIGGDGFYIVVDPKNNQYLYGESQNGAIVRSTNGGSSFLSAVSGIDSNEYGNWSTPLVMDPNNTDVLFTGFQKLYKTTNKAVSWTAISPVLTQSPSHSSLGAISTVAVAPSNSNVIYVGTDDSQVWVTKNGGSTWTEVSSALPYRAVTRIAVDAANPDVAYITFSGLKWYDAQPHIFRTTNAGQSWANISSNLPDVPLNALALDPQLTNTIYVGADIGAFVSTNLGQTWEPLGIGLPAIVVSDFVFDKTNGYLVAGTHGRGMYKLKLPWNPVALEDEAPAQTQLTITNAPNPFGAETQIHVEAPQSGWLKLEVFDLTGRRIRTLANQQTDAGKQTFRFIPDAQLRNGTYFVRASLGQTALTRKIVLLR